LTGRTSGTSRRSGSTNKIASVTPQAKKGTPLASPETRKLPYNKESTAKPLFPELSTKDNPVSKSAYRYERVTLSDSKTELKSELTKVIYNEGWKSILELSMTLHAIC
jgi:hypothetical protein